MSAPGIADSVDHQMERIDSTLSLLRSSIDVIAAERNCVRAVLRRIVAEYSQGGVSPSAIERARSVLGGAS